MKGGTMVQGMPSKGVTYADSSDVFSSSSSRLSTIDISAIAARAAAQTVGGEDNLRQKVRNVCCSFSVVARNNR
jgi:hypothetical protein